MTHKSNHLDFPVQKAGQAVGAALLQQPLLRTISSRTEGGAVRVAGGDATSKKTSTAALVSFRPGLLPNHRRAPCHPRFCRGHLRLPRGTKGGGPLSIKSNHANMECNSWRPS